MTRFSLLHALEGAGLFAFIPLVLFLYLRQPLGPAVSILVGLVVMFGHRLVASPWMMRHARQRCLWCGGAAAGRFPLTVQAGGQPVPLAGCSAAHSDHAARFLTFIYRWRALIGVGIFAPLAVLLAGSLALAAGHPLLPQRWNTWQFRTTVALTVVTASTAWHAVGTRADALRSPFPLHNLFLLGIRNTLWVFRVVGTWWLVAGVMQLLEG
ncbi:MAG: hypothetical protein ACM3NQ_18180 [Bacteroidales bacterium]